MLEQATENGEYVGLFFFRRGATTTPAPHSTADHILLQQLLSAAGHRMDVQTQEVTQQSISAMTEADGLETSKQAALLFIEQPVEQQARRRSLGQGERTERSGARLVVGGEAQAR